MTLVEETWERIDEATRGTWWHMECLTVAERDQMEALADDLNRQFVDPPSRSPEMLP